MSMEETCASGSSKPRFLNFVQYANNQTHRPTGFETAPASTRLLYETPFRTNCKLTTIRWVLTDTQ